MAFLLKYMSLEDFAQSDDHYELFRQIAKLFLSIRHLKIDNSFQEDFFEELSLHNQKAEDIYLRKKPHKNTSDTALTLELNINLANALVANRFFYSKENLTPLVFTALGQNIPTNEYKTILTRLRNKYNKELEIYNCTTEKIRTNKKEHVFNFDIDRIIKIHTDFQEYKSLYYPILCDEAHDNMLKARFLESKYRHNQEMLFFILQYALVCTRSYSPEEKKNRSGALISLKFVSLILRKRILLQIDKLKSIIKHADQYINNDDINKINSIGGMKIEKELFIKHGNNYNVISFLKDICHKLKETWVKELQQAYVDKPESPEYTEALIYFRNNTKVTYDAACKEANHFMRKVFEPFVETLIKEKIITPDAIALITDRNKDPVKMYRNKQNGKNIKDTFGARVVCKDMETAYLVRKLVSERLLSGKENIRPDIFKDFHKKPKEKIIDKALGTKKTTYRDVLHCTYEKTLSINGKQLPFEIQYVGGEEANDNNQDGPDTDYLTVYAQNYNKINLEESFACINVSEFGKFKTNGALIEKIESGETVKTFLFRLLNTYRKEFPKKLNIYKHTLNGLIPMTNLDDVIDPGCILELKSIDPADESLKKAYRAYQLALAMEGVENNRSRIIRINIQSSENNGAQTYEMNIPGDASYDKLLIALREKNLLPGYFYIGEKLPDGKYKPILKTEKKISPYELLITTPKGKHRIRENNANNFKNKNNQINPDDYRIDNLPKTP